MTSSVWVFCTFLLIYTFSFSVFYGILLFFITISCSVCGLSFSTFSFNFKPKVKSQIMEIGEPCVTGRSASFNYFCTMKSPSFTPNFPSNPQFLISPMFFYFFLIFSKILSPFILLFSPLAPPLVTSVWLRRMYLKLKTWKSV